MGLGRILGLLPLLFVRVHGMTDGERLKMVLSLALLCACGIVVPALWLWLGLVVLGCVWARQTNRPELLVKMAKIASLLLWLVVAVLMQDGAVVAINNTVFGAPSLFGTSLVALWLMLLFFAVVAELGLLRPVRKNAIAVCEQSLLLPVLRQLRSRWAHCFRE